MASPALSVPNPVAQERSREGSGRWSQMAAVGSVVPDDCSGVSRVCGPRGDDGTVPRDLQTAAQETPQEVWASLGWSCPTGVSHVHLWANVRLL